MEFLILFSVVALALAMLLTFLEFLFHLEEKKKEKINSKEIKFQPIITIHIIEVLKLK